MISYNEWLCQFAYVGAGISKGNEGTMEEAMLQFFHDGVNKWIKKIGYKWSIEESRVARKFLHLCYMINTTDDMTTNLTPPEPKHRNLYEDRDTFDKFIDTETLINFLNQWEFRTEIVGTQFDYLIKEFCYIWVDVTSGKPGAYTRDILDAGEEEEEDEVSGPDVQTKKKWDLY